MADWSGPDWHSAAIIAGRVNTASPTRITLVGITVPATRDGMTGSADILEPLVERAREAGPRGVDALLRALRPIVYRWALVRTRDADDAEDITQSVLVSVHERIGDFEGRSRFTTWLYRVTANAAAQLYRKRGVRQRALEAWDGMRIDRVDLEANDPLDTIESDETRESIRTMMQKLSEAQRVAFDLVDLQGYPPAEAAAMLDVNGNTLRVHLMRARRTMRRLFMERLAPTEDGQ